MKQSPYQKLIGLISLLIVSIALPSNIFADQGFSATVDYGTYRLVFNCHYEPTPHCTLSDISNLDSTEPDTLSLPPFVVMYNDTFPITSIDPQGYMHGYIGPKVLDLRSIKNPGKSTSRLITGNRLDEVILSADTDTLKFSMSHSNISKINLDNVSSLYPMIFAYTPKLRYLTLGPKIHNIPYGCFLGAGITYLSAEGVTSIDDFAFENSKINYIEKSNIKSIGYAAFHKCTLLRETPFITPALKSVEANAFNGSSLRSLNLYDAKVTYTRRYSNIRPWPLLPWNTVLTDTLTKLNDLNSTKLKYLPFVNEGMYIDCPGLEAIQYKNLNGVSITSFPTLKQLILTDCAVNELVIPDSLLNGLAINYPPYGPEGDSYTYAWDALQIKNSVIDKLTIGKNNTSYLVKDSILLSVPPQWPTDLPYPIPMMNFRVELTNLKGEPIVLRGYRNPNPDYSPSTDTVAVAAVGYPRGKWFVPKNNRWGGVTYCCDYVDNIRLNPSFEPKGYYLRTYTRPDTERINVYVGLPTSKASDITACCASPLMDFYVPQGMLGRFIAAGLPADRTFEDTDGVLGIDDTEADPAASAPRGRYTIDGRRIPDGATLAPGFYIIDGRKTYIR